MTPLCFVINFSGQTSTSTSKNSVVSLPDLSTDSRGGMVWGTTGGQDGSVAVAVRGKKDKVKDSLVSTESSKVSVSTTPALLQ